MKTYVVSNKEIKRQWHLVDLKNQVLGRAATAIAAKLVGKHKPNFSPHLDNGDWVVAMNAQEILVTGKKMGQKVYFRHSGWPGGEKRRTLTEQMKLDPRKVVELAVAGMLPKNKLRQGRLRRLKVFAGKEHSYGDKFKV
ncbi:MAG: 50S ribosomal protein L13 [Candidatus Chisholmbacteria bacterium]|nr:50S ribosomal protein L13 [Candidatus Chisholmbacteria bacterium]